MRTSQQLRRIAGMADALRQERGDTEWSTEDADRVTQAFELLDGVGEAVPSGLVRDRWRVAR